MKDFLLSDDHMVSRCGSSFHIHCTTQNAVGKTFESMFYCKLTHRCLGFIEERENMHAISMSFFQPP